MWFGVSNFGKWSAEFGPELTIDFKARAQDADSRLAKADDAYGRWVTLGDVALWKAQAPTTDEAKAAAIELLGLAEGYKTDWNYGNAIHKANSSLGRIALRQGDRSAARKHLLESAKSEGSPQMNSFGPNMIFAKEMLEAGEKVAVIEYLQLCANFWAMDEGRLAVWKNMIIEGRVPKFGGNLLV
jgi:hypothetical protein